MAYVYLIGEQNNSGNYKIGSTRHKNIDDRLKQLQTGNPNELFVKSYFKTDKPFKLETMLHNYYKTNNNLNEWFSLTDEQVKEFDNVCKKYQNIIDSLIDNHFF